MDTDPDDENAMPSMFSEDPFSEYVYDESLDFAFEETTSAQQWASISGDVDLTLDTSQSAHNPDTTFGPTDDHLEREATLLMFYLDYVFRDQFPFYNPALSQGGRSWLLPLLTLSKPVYYASLSLSAVYWQRTLGRHGSVELKQTLQQEEERHHVMALQELRVYIEALHIEKGPQSLKDCISALACIMQLIFFESLKNRLGNWRVHLDAAATLIHKATQVLKHKPNPTPQTLPQQRTPLMFSPVASRLFCKDQGLEEESLSFEMQAASEFVIAVFVWFNALSCASLGSQSIFYDHRHLLKRENGAVQMQHLTGCSNWVVAEIIEIAALEQWKKEAYEKRCLSIRELACRAQAIEERLNRQIGQTLHPAKELKDRLQGFDDETSNATAGAFSGARVWDNERRRQRAAFCLTHIFALASLTYLHVIVDGFNPRLPEIRSSVSRTLAAFHGLLPEDAELLVPRLTWPLCVTGLMVSNDQQQQRVIKRYLTPAGSGRQDLVGSLVCSSASSVLQVLEEAWRVHEEHMAAASFDWAAATSILGSPILLI